MMRRKNIDWQQYVAERRDVLLSMDRERILAFARKYDIRIIQAAAEDEFWIMVHKARTGSLDLPRAARLESKVWLAARGYTSHDDDLPHLVKGVNP
jgi:hypothetical protein